MEACSECGDNKLFIERAWGVTDHRELYRVVCKKNGHGVGGWSWSIEEAKEHWNRVTKRINDEATLA